MTAQICARDGGAAQKITGCGRLAQCVDQPGYDDERHTEQNAYTDAGIDDCRADGNRARRCLRLECRFQLSQAGCHRDGGNRGTTGLPQTGLAGRLGWSSPESKRQLGTSTV